MADGKLVGWLALAEVQCQIKRRLAEMDAEIAEDERRYGALRCYWPKAVLEKDIERRKFGEVPA